jgi:hypothetical protein
MADAPRITGAKGAAIAAREARLSDALRDNLRRRKEQARAREKRTTDPPADAAADGEPTA